MENNISEIWSILNWYWLPNIVIYLAAGTFYKNVPESRCKDNKMLGFSLVAKSRV